MNRSAISERTTSILAAPIKGILQRRCACGNEATSGGECRECSKKGQFGLRTNLQVNQSNDVHEQEADAVARQVMSAPPPAIMPSTAQAQLKRNSSEAGVPGGASASAPLKTGAIQAKPAGLLKENLEGEDERWSKLNQSKGSRLPSLVRKYMKPRFGVDFSHVRVHTGSEAALMSQNIGAQAFTHGSDIYYKADHNPGNLELTAHELTHAVQYPIIRMRQSLRNRTMERMIQAKLQISQPGDRLEQEADRTADAVMRMPDTTKLDDEENKIQAKPLPSVLQPKNAVPELTNATWPHIQRLCTECDKERSGQAEKKLIQTKENNDQVPHVTPDIEANINSLNGSGSPLPNSARNHFEPRFGADFSRVRIHHNKESAEMASVIGAKAFTYKNNIVFSQGAYDIESLQGKKLLAHELTHVIQQDNTISSMEIEKGRREKLQRTPDSGGIADERYVYSTNCGWIDWGHSNPTLARNLIAIIREASKRIKRREDVLQTKIDAELPQFITEEKCPVKYEKDEVKNSASDAPVQQIIDTPSGATEIRIGGFEVGKFDPSKFKDMLKAHAWWATKVAALKGVPVDLRIGGLTDCVDKEAKNTTLRNSRASAVFVEMAKAVPGQTLIHIPITIPYNQFFTSNATKEGRKFNRGIVLQFIPHASREVVKTPAMESSAFGITLTEITPTVSLQKFLSEQEVLQAALTTFMLQSLFFEAGQEWTDFFGGSSFAEEDLVSNLIGFYRAAEGYSKDEVSKFCGAWNKVDTLKKFMSYSFQKNRTFRPLSLPSGGSWPKELTTIKPMSLNAENFSILSMFIKPSFVAPNKCQINADGTISCS